MSLRVYRIDTSEQLNPGSTFCASSHVQHSSTPAQRQWTAISIACTRASVNVRGVAGRLTETALDPAAVALLSTSPEREDTVLVRDPFAD